MESTACKNGMVTTPHIIEHTLTLKLNSKTYQNLTSAVTIPFTFTYIKKFDSFVILRTINNKAQVVPEKEGGNGSHSKRSMCMHNRLHRKQCNFNTMATLVRFKLNTFQSQILSRDAINRSTNTFRCRRPASHALAQFCRVTMNQDRTSLKKKRKNVVS